MRGGLMTKLDKLGRRGRRKCGAPRTERAEQMSSSLRAAASPARRGQPVLKPDYLGDRRLASVKVPELREFLTSKGLGKALWPRPPPNLRRLAR